MKNRKLAKFLSVILSFTIIFSIFPMSSVVYADEVGITVAGENGDGTEGGTECVYYAYTLVSKNAFYDLVNTYGYNGVAYSYLSDAAKNPTSIDDALLVLRYYDNNAEVFTQWGIGVGTSPFSKSANAPDGAAGDTVKNGKFNNIIVPYSECIVPIEKDSWNKIANLYAKEYKYTTSQAKEKIAKAFKRAFSPDSRNGDSSWSKESKLHTYWQYDYSYRNHLRNNDSYDNKYIVNTISIKAFVGDTPESTSLRFREDFKTKNFSLNCVYALDSLYAIVKGQKYVISSNNSAGYNNLKDYTAGNSRYNLVTSKTMERYSGNPNESFESLINRSIKDNTLIKLYEVNNAGDCELPEITVNTAIKYNNVTVKAKYVRITKVQVEERTRIIAGQYENKEGYNFKPNQLNIDIEGNIKEATENKIEVTEKRISDTYNRSVYYLANNVSYKKLEELGIWAGGGTYNYLGKTSYVIEKSISPSDSIAVSTPNYSMRRWMDLTSETFKSDIESITIPNSVKNSIPDYKDSNTTNINANLNMSLESNKNAGEKVTLLSDNNSKQFKLFFNKGGAFGTPITNYNRSTTNKYTNFKSSNLVIGTAQNKSSILSNNVPTLSLNGQVGSDINKSSFTCNTESLLKIPLSKNKVWKLNVDTSANDYFVNSKFKSIKYNNGVKIGDLRGVNCWYNLLQYETCNKVGYKFVFKAPLKRGMGYFYNITESTDASGKKMVNFDYKTSYNPISKSITKLNTTIYLTATFIQPVLVGETVTKDVAGME